MSEIDWQSLWPMLVFAVTLLVLFWFIVIRPVRGQQRRHQETIANLSEGDKIVTAGGIYGKIVTVRESEMDVEVAAGCVITFDRRAARRVLD